MSSVTDAKLNALNQQAEAEAQVELQEIDAHDVDATYIALVKNLLVFVALAKNRSMPMHIQQNMLERMNKNVQVFEYEKGKAPSA